MFIGRDESCIVDPYLVDYSQFTLPSTYDQRGGWDDAQTIWSIYLFLSEFTPLGLVSW